MAESHHCCRRGPYSMPLAHRTGRQDCQRAEAEAHREQQTPSALQVEAMTGTTAMRVAVELPWRTACVSSFVHGLRRPVRLPL